MNAAHLHLLVNHLPVVGMLVALVFFIVALIRKNDLLVKAALWMFVVLGVVTIAVFLTGDPAAEMVEILPGIAAPEIGAHADAAERALIGTIILAVLASIGLISYRRRVRFPGWFLIIILAVAITVSGLMGWTANQGGKIRHTEINLPVT
jgi:uncharacterized membrane protein